jgi:hypothetical protein
MTSIELSTAIELRPITALVPYAGNARTHSEEQIEQLVKSIRRFGWTNPVLIGADGTIVAGHARVLAARKLDMAEVPCIVLDHLSEAEQRALVLADNKLALNAGWDDAMLRAELQALQDEDFDVEVIGFNDDELRALLEDPAGDGQTAEEPAPEDSAPEAPSDPVTRAGDIWCIGKHRLICGDCRDSGVVKLLMAGQVANVAITSPPYASQREYDQSSGFKPIPPDEYVDWYKAVAAGIEKVLAADGSYFLNIKEHAQDGQRSLYVKDLTLAHVRQWCWMFVDELCWRKTDNGVLDPFGGSGTTLIACEKAGRQARLIELAPNYCDVIVRRWQEFTGKTATLEATGEQFNAIGLAGLRSSRPQNAELHPH